MTNRIDAPDAIGDRLALRALLLASVFAFPGTSMAQDAPDAANSVEAQGAEIIVTAQRREQRAQDVPLSLTILDDKAIDNLQLTKLEDYVRYLPSVSANGSNPGFNPTVVVRGIVTDVGNVASGSLPAVGQYIDEQPVTTIDGAPDLHLYDIARVEQLSGPQGTLFGASSLGGVMRIITNKPDTTKTAFGVDAEVNKFSKGGFGGSLEGFVNLPVSDRVALRGSAWYIKRGGFIDNVPASRTYSTGITVDNSRYAEKDYNHSETYGGRVALAVQLNDDWTVTPSFMAQKTNRNGQFSYKPTLGDLKTDAYTQEDGRDRWYQAALTVQGKIGDFDMTYAGGYFDRKARQHVNYADYDYLYDQAYGIFPGGAQRVNDLGEQIDPTQTLINENDFSKQSHEFRIVSPADKRIRAVAGAFYQRQEQDIYLNYNIPGLAASRSVSTFPGATWITSQQRIDRDYALYGQVEFDIVSNLTLIGGLRGYKYDNSLFGWFGGRNNEAFCLGPAATRDAPCVNLGIPDSNGRVVPRRVKGTGTTYRLGATWKITPDNLIYFTVANGFRPGGTNRLGERGQTVLASATVPYKPDYLTNYELGTKNSFANGRIILNLTLFNQEWRDIQLGTAVDGVNLIGNVAKARSRGVEFAAGFRPAQGLSINLNAAYIDAKLLADYEVAGNVVAPAGSRLAYSPKFKGNAIVRYEWQMGKTEPFVQVAQTYQSNVVGGFSNFGRDLFGKFPAYGVTDLSLGFRRGNFSLDGYVTNLFDKRGVTYRSYLFFQKSIGPYQYVIQPRQVGLRASFRY